MLKKLFLLITLLAFMPAVALAGYAPGGPLLPQPSGTTNADVGATESFEIRNSGTLSGSSVGNGPAIPLYGGQVNLAVSFVGLSASGATVQVQTATADGLFVSTLGFYGASGAPAQPALNITADGKYNFIVGGDTQFRVIETVAGTSGTITYTYGATQNAGRLVAALTPPPSYPLLSGTAAAASYNGTAMTLAGGNYLFGLSGTFGGATVTLNATANGVTTALGSYTSTPAAPPVFAIATGTVVQAVVTGATSGTTALTASLGGLGAGGLAAPQTVNSGLGALTAIPAGSTNGTALSAPPAGAKGVRFYLPTGSTITYTIAAAQPTAAPGNTFTISPSTGPNFDESLNGQSIFITAITGAPLYRWF